MSISKNALLKVFALNERTVHLDSIDADVVIRNLSNEESDSFTQSYVEGLDSDGKPILDLDKSMDVKYMKVSAILVEPKLTVEELKGMYGGKEFLNEVLKEAGEADEEKFDEEGNED